MKLKFKQITTTEDFLNLKEQWNRLVKSTDVDHAFMRHEWFECWIKYLKPDSKLAIQTAWQDDKLVAIAPLHIIEQKRKGIPLKILSFLASGITPRCNFIVDKAANFKEVFDSLFEIDNWQVMELKAMESDIPLTNSFIKYLSEGKKYVIEKGIQSPYEVLETNWEAFLNSKSGNYRKTCRQYQNRLKKTGDFKILRINNYVEFEQNFESLIEVSSHSWKAEVDADLKTMPRMAEFYKEFSRLGSNDNLFVAYFLFIKGKAVAFHYYLNFSNHLVCIRSDFDKSCSYYKPGIVLQDQSIKDVLDNGEILEYDQAGTASEHKVRLLKDIRSHINITVGRPGLYGNLIMFMKEQFAKRN